MKKFLLKWQSPARDMFNDLESAAKTTFDNRRRKGISKSSKQEGLFKQLKKAIDLLEENPKHPGLNSHEFSGLRHPFDPADKVFESYVQNNTPAAYRVFWCYGPERKQITILGITPHP